jgi:UDP-N-acetylglucosamine--N-acetylmuramyl-(pentapeptide) pyrophosphoryl-undecaprenol N-acetylglucosamine transferase
MNRAGKPYRIIISGGGTGGHIYPAIAIADSIRERIPDAEILFVGAEGKMEMELVPAAGYKIQGLRISGIQRRFTMANLSFPFKVLSSLRSAGRIVRAFKPQVAVGVGGYASGPLLWKASASGIPTLIQEQNSYAGLTNRLLGRRARKICVAYEHMERFFPVDKLIVTGNPVRSDIGSGNLTREESVTHFGLDPSRKTLLVIGGSLGARTINESVLAGMGSLKDKGVQVIWQAGRLYIEEMKARAGSALAGRIQILEFIKEMDRAYAAADLVISRAGALAISELCIAGKPVVLVPSPNVAEDHQTKNAQSLVERQAAVLVPDHEARTRLVGYALSLLEDGDRLDTMSRNIVKMARPDAASAIANEVIDLIS